MSKTKNGFTVVEMLLAITLIAILTAFVTPSMRDSLVKESVRGARMTAATHVARARGTASSRGCSAVLHVEGGANRIWVTSCPVNQINGIDTVGTVDDLTVRFNVDLSTNVDSVVFAPTGIMASAGLLSMRFARAEFQDSLAVSPTGRMLW